MDYTLIKNWEGFSAKPYLCPSGHPTIGYGSITYENGQKVTMQDKAITMEKAETMLNDWINKNVKPTINKHVKVKLNDNQMSAIASFIYNLGVSAFTTSTFLKHINAKKTQKEITEAWMLWNKATVNGKKVEMAGLTKRRKAEVDLYFR